MEKEENIDERLRNELLPKISLGQFLLDKMRENNDSVFLIDENNNSQLINSDVLEKSVKLAKFLQTHGVKIGDRISIASENRLNWIIPAYATFYIGAICVPYNPMYTEWELQNMLNISKPRIVFVSKRTEKLFVKLQPSLSWQIEIIELDDKPLMPNIRTLTNILNNEEVNFLEYNAVDIGDNSKHPAIILHSSGTTGLPKGVTLSHKNMIASLMEISKQKFMNITPADRFILFLPFYHAYAFHILMLCSIYGASSVIMSPYEPERFLELIEKYKPTYLTLVPPIMIFLAKHPLVKKYDFRSVREIMCAAAPLAKEIVNLVKSRLGVKYIRNAYGMTEVTLMSHMSDRQEDSTNVMSLQSSRLFTKIVDLKTKETLSVNQFGEICFKGDQIMLRYWGNPNATKQTIDEDGWLHSGDLGYYDERGGLHVVDRLKELIKYKGFQVSPSEIEIVLLLHPAVKEAAVCGRPNLHNEELPVAMIVKQSGAIVTAEDIVEFVKEKLSPQKWLRGGVQFVDAIPKNATGKILRYKVKSVIQTMISKL